jgi:hypothetical protein
LAIIASASIGMMVHYRRHEHRQWYAIDRAAGEKRKNGPNSWFVKCKDCTNV